MMQGQMASQQQLSTRRASIDQESSSPAFPPGAGAAQADDRRRRREIDRRMGNTGLGSTERVYSVTVLILARIIHERRSEKPPGRLWQGFAAISNGACLNTTRVSKSSL